MLKVKIWKVPSVCSHSTGRRIEIRTRKTNEKVKKRNNVSVGRHHSKVVDIRRFGSQVMSLTELSDF